MDGLAPTSILVLLMDHSTARWPSRLRFLCAIGFASVVALTGCGDPAVTIWLRNDSATRIVIAIKDGAAGPAYHYLAGPGAIGYTFTSLGTFRGRITTMDATNCKILGEVDGDGGIFVVIVSPSGVPEVASFGDAFPSSSPSGALPQTTECGGSA